MLFLLSFRILILFKAWLPVCKCFLPCHSMTIFSKNQSHTYHMLGTAQRISSSIYLARFIKGAGVLVEVCVCVLPSTGLDS